MSKKIIGAFGATKEPTSTSQPDNGGGWSQQDQFLIGLPVQSPR